MRISSYSRFSTSALAHLSSVRKTVDEAVSSDLVYTDGPAHGLDYDEAFVGAVELPDGRVLLSAYSGRQWAIYDPTENSLTNIATQSGSSRYNFGCLALNGLAVFAPRLASTVKYFDWRTNSFGEVTAVGGYDGAVALKNGKVLLVPRTAAYLGIFDPVNKTFSLSSVANPNALSAGCLLPDGRVIMVSWLSSDQPVYIYDPNTDTMETGPYIGAGPWAGACLTKTGDVVITPYSGNGLRIYRPQDGSFYERERDDFLGTGKCRGNGKLLPDGRIVFPPYNYGAVPVYDPVADTVESIDIGISGGTAQFAGAFSLPDGSVGLVPFDAGKIVIVSGTTSGKLSDAWRQGIFNNCN
ncbi:hypothetical protein ABEB22_12525 [Thioclava sp. 'Guangxiensis']|uniref:hypothetical protein n=1 Tax=Thioclava sp. 'Guangxiensis' TaxID=3149044 RepID=UPI00387830F0